MQGRIWKWFLAGARGDKGVRRVFTVLPLTKQPSVLIAAALTGGGNIHDSHLGK